MKYSDIDPRKKAFVFELDNVIYPEKDYLFQVYYLFAGLIEYTELSDAKTITDLMVATYTAEGRDVVFDRVKEELGIDEKYRISFQHLLLTAKLPLKLLVYQAVLDLMQEVVIDRKKLYLVTNGNPAQQLNKIKQTEWHGLEPYLTCYFAEETLPKPEPDVLHLLMKEQGLTRKDILMIGNSADDVLCAEATGVDYINVKEFL
ncbi:HAD hydrolase-like protein [Mucilaginibacter sp.]|uniref:HAD family hydrolase n=1 Tax=Mucilaginibacter sp. TaxID=1882438 RepID=UPI00262988B3|nr:HAD hydrolase-like protein [Mucilaginibacter sp.]MDB5031443.1 phosphatase YigB, superfamily [Mucilaginibacter sp.]